MERRGRVTTSCTVSFVWLTVWGRADAHVHGWQWMSLGPRRDDPPPYLLSDIPRKCLGGECDNGLQFIVISCSLHAVHTMMYKAHVRSKAHMYVCMADMYAKLHLSCSSAMRQLSLAYINYSASQMFWSLDHSSN